MTDYFAALGLPASPHTPQEINARFEARRAALLEQLHSAETHSSARAALDELHLAQRLLCDPARQSAHLLSLKSEPATDDACSLRHLVAACMEDGLLRYSRRKQILEFARSRGISDFQAQLIMAQVQFGESPLAIPPQHDRQSAAPRAGAAGPAAPLLAAATLLAAAMFVMLSIWLRV